MKTTYKFARTKCGQVFSDYMREVELDAYNLVQEQKSSETENQAPKD